VAVVEDGLHGLRESLGNGAAGQESLLDVLFLEDAQDPINGVVRPVFALAPHLVIEDAVLVWLDILAALEIERQEDASPLAVRPADKMVVMVLLEHAPIPCPLRLESRVLQRELNRAAPLLPTCGRGCCRPRTSPASSNCRGTPCACWCRTASGIAPTCRSWDRAVRRGRCSSWRPRARRSCRSWPGTGTCRAAGCIRRDIFPSWCRTARPCWSDIRSPGCGPGRRSACGAPALSGSAWRTTSLPWSSHRACRDGLR